MWAEPKCNILVCPPPPKSAIGEHNDENDDEPRDDDDADLKVTNLFMNQRV